MDFDRSVVRIGSLAGATGALLGMVGNLLHPATPHDDGEGVARAIAGSDIWVADHLAIVVGLILMFGGLVAIRHSIAGGPGEVFARFGHFAAVAGTTVGLVLVILDGVAAKHLATEWMSAPAHEQAMALRVLLAEETVNFALASLFNIIFAGFAFGLYGLAAIRSGMFPRWSAWLVVGAAAGSIFVGFLQATAGEPTAASRVLTIIFPTVLTLWLAATNISILRRLSRGGGGRVIPTGGPVGTVR